MVAFLVLTVTNSCHGQMVPKKGILGKLDQKCVCGGFKLEARALVWIESLQFSMERVV